MTIRRNVIAIRGDYAGPDADFACKPAISAAPTMQAIPIHVRNGRNTRYSAVPEADVPAVHACVE